MLEGEVKWLVRVGSFGGEVKELMLKESIFSGGGRGGGEVGGGGGGGGGGR